MIDTVPQSLHQTPDSSEFVSAAKRRSRRIAFWGIILAAAAATSFVAFGLDSIITPIVLLVCVAVPILLWRFSVLALYIPFALVCLIEIFPTQAKDAITDQIPVFENLNTIIQRHSGADFKALPFNVLEAFLVLAVAISLIRAVYTNTTNLRAGALIWPILIYIAFVGLGELVGMSSGGDFKISMQEVRSQVYFLMAYIMGVNMIREVKHLRTLQWIMVICIGIKGILYTFRRYVTMAGMPLPDQGVGSHEEAFFFDMFEAYFLVLLICGLNKRMRITMFILLPLVLLGNLSTNRRAATAAIIVALPILMMAAYQAFPTRRKLIVSLAISLSVGFSIYYPMFKNSNSALGQPARAIRSHFDPDKRDALSNAYRDAEEADLYATIKLSPIQGYGYGKRMLHAVPIADISKQYDWWDIMTHNQILWVWMRVGTFGFLAFWGMIASILILACKIIRNQSIDIEIKSTAIFTLMATSMLLIFGLLDLQLSNFRDMLFTGFWAGALAATPTIKPITPPSSKAV